MPLRVERLSRLALPRRPLPSSFTGDAGGVVAEGPGGAEEGRSGMDGRDFGLRDGDRCTDEELLDDGSTDDELLDDGTEEVLLDDDEGTDPRAGADGNKSDGGIAELGIKIGGDGIPRFCSCSSASSSRSSSSSSSPYCLRSFAKPESSQQKSCRYASKLS